MFKSRFSVFNYEDIPPGYYHEKMHLGSSPQRFWHQKKFESIARLIPDDASVLDIGCGPGSFLDVLGRIKPKAQAVGVDVASPQILYAKEKIEPKYPGRVRFQLIDGSDDQLPYPDNFFDCVCSIEVIEHIHPYLAIKTLSEARRVLKPDGVLLVTTPNYRSLWPVIEVLLNRLSPVNYHEQHINKFTPNSLVKFLESGGLDVERIFSIFVLAPFLAGLNWRMAEALHKFERYLPFRAGSLLVAQCKRLELPKEVSHPPLERQAI